MQRRNVKDIMPRHTFKFPQPVVKSIKQYVQSAIEVITPKRYQQEPNYTAALLGRLEGIAYEGEYGHVTFSATIFNDRGPNSAESKYGADHAIIATISNDLISIKKVILIQAKLGIIKDLNTHDMEFLKEQINKMRQIVFAPKIMEIPEINEIRYPAIISGNRILANGPYKSIPLPEYFVTRITTTLDGCTNREIVDSVEDSSLSKLSIKANIKSIKNQ